MLRSRLCLLQLGEEDVFGSPSPEYFDAVQSAGKDVRCAIINRTLCLPQPGDMTFLFHLLIHDLAHCGHVWETRYHAQTHPSAAGSDHHFGPALLTISKFSALDEDRCETCYDRITCIYQSNTCAACTKTFCKCMTCTLQLNTCFACIQTRHKGITLTH